MKFHAFKNLYTEKYRVALGNEHSINIGELEALILALQYFNRGYYRNCTIWVQQQKILDSITDLNNCALDKRVCKIHEIITSIEGKGRNITILKQESPNIPKTLITAIDKKKEELKREKIKKDRESKRKYKRKYKK